MDNLPPFLIKRFKKKEKITPGISARYMPNNSISSIQEISYGKEVTILIIHEGEPTFVTVCDKYSESEKRYEVLLDDLGVSIYNK